MDYQEVKKNPNVDEIDNLKVDTDEMSWGMPMRNSRGMGNAAMTESGVAGAMGGEAISNGMNVVGGVSQDKNVDAREHGLTGTEGANAERPKLGQIVPAMPPGYEEVADGETDQTEPKIAAFERAKAMRGDRLSDEVGDILQNRERKLDADGDIAAFTDDIYDFNEQFQGRKAA